jgi:hypothetical protein
VNGGPVFQAPWLVYLDAFTGAEMPVKDSNILVNVALKSLTGKTPGFYYKQ